MSGGGRPCGALTGAGAADDRGSTHYDPWYIDEATAQPGVVHVLRHAADEQAVRSWLFGRGFLHRLVFLAVVLRKVTAVLILDLRHVFP